MSRIFASLVSAWVKKRPASRTLRAPRRNSGNMNSAATAASQKPRSIQVSVLRSSESSAVILDSLSESKNWISESSTEVSAVFADSSDAMRFMTSLSTAGITIWSSLSLRKPPSGNGMGAPVSDPTVRILSVALTRPSASRASLTENLGKPSVINNTPPFVSPAVSSSPAERTSASVALDPCNGMMSGDRALNKFSMVRASSVSGVTTCASPAKTTMPVTPSERVSKTSIIFCRARRTRLGCVSVAHID